MRLSINNERNIGYYVYWVLCTLGIMSIGYFGIGYCGIGYFVFGYFVLTPLQTLFTAGQRLPLVRILRNQSIGRDRFQQSKTSHPMTSFLLCTKYKSNIFKTNTGYFIASVIFQRHERFWNWLNLQMMTRQSSNSSGNSQNRTTTHLSSINHYDESNISSCLGLLISIRVCVMFSRYSALNLEHFRCVRDECS